MVVNRLLRVVYPFGIIILIITPLLFLQKGDVLLYLNQFHSRFFHIFFKCVSAIGSGYSIGIIGIVVFLFFKVKYLIQLALSFLLQLGFVLIFKFIFFYRSFRPFKYFGKNEGEIVLNTVEGVKLYLFHTFPSGHTATVFFIGTFVALFVNNRILTWVLFLLATLVGFSRIYLVQHFFIDVYFGAFFGFVSSLLAFVTINKMRQVYWFNRRFFPKLFRFINDNSVINITSARAIKDGFFKY